MNAWERFVLVALVGLAIAAGFWVTNELDEYGREVDALQAQAAGLASELDLTRSHVDSLLWELAVMEGQVCTLQNQVDALTEGPCCVTMNVNVTNKTKVHCWR